jgi:hypothetical protein
VRLRRRVYQRDGGFYVDSGVVRQPRRGEKYLGLDGVSVVRALTDHLNLSYSILRRVRALTLPFGFYLVTEY